MLAQLLHAHGLDDRAVLHHRQRLAHVRHHGEIVADQHVGQTVLALQAHQQVEHLRLHRHVERRGGFIEQHDLRIGDQRARHRHPLALATGNLVRIAKPERGVEADFLERRHHAFLDTIEPCTRAGSLSMVSTVWRGCSDP